MRQFHYKMQELLQIGAILLQKCDSYYKMRQRLLQIATAQGIQYTAKVPEISFA